MCLAYETTLGPLQSNPQFVNQCRGQGSNLRPLGYEPSELPLLHPGKSIIAKSLEKCQDFLKIFFRTSVSPSQIFAASSLTWLSQQAAIA